MEIEQKPFDYQADLPELDAIESVRRRPHMYLGDIRESGAFHALQELVANALDQFLAGEADHVKIEHEGLCFKVYDNGGGFPMDDPAIFEALTEFHNKPTADDHAPHVHLSLRGVGLYPINALSKRFLLQTVYQGESYEISFEKGRQRELKRGVSLTFERGTQVTALLDEEIFECRALHGDFVRKRLFEVAHLFPGLSLELNEEVFKTKGLLQLAEIHQRYSDWGDSSYGNTRRFSFEKNSERLWLNVALLGETEKAPAVYSWVNGTPTPEHGTHVKGVVQAAQTQGWKPETILVSVIFQEVQYAGPTKNKLYTGWVTSEVERLLKEPLLEFLEAQESKGT